MQGGFHTWQKRGQDRILPYMRRLSAIIVARFKQRFSLAASDDDHQTTRILAMFMDGGII